MNRRSLLRYGGRAAALAPFWAAAPALAGLSRVNAAQTVPPGVLRRIGITTVCFRERFVATRDKKAGPLPAGEELTLLTGQKAIIRMIPDSLDLLTISVRAGLGFDAALQKVVEKVKGPLSDEFRRALAEVRVGKQRRDALRDIIARTDVPPLTNFIGAIIQAEQLGVSISKVLQVQSEQLRIERRQRAEEQAAKAPIKMLFPLVGCIFPSLFIVILGPAIILIVQNFSKGTP